MASFPFDGAVTAHMRWGIIIYVRHRQLLELCAICASETALLCNARAIYREDVTCNSNVRRVCILSLVNGCSCMRSLASKMGFTATSTICSQ